MRKCNGDFRFGVACKPTKKKTNCVLFGERNEALFSIDNIALSHLIGFQRQQSIGNVAKIAPTKLQQSRM